MTEWIRTCERREQLSGHERERGRRRSRSWSEGREFLDSGEGCITISGLHQGAVAGRGKLVASRRALANHTSRTLAPRAGSSSPTSLVCCQPRAPHAHSDTRHCRSTPRRPRPRPRPRASPSPTTTPPPPHLIARPPTLDTRPSHPRHGEPRCERRRKPLDQPLLGPPEPHRRPGHRDRGRVGARSVASRSCSGRARHGGAGLATGAVEPSAHSSAALAHPAAHPPHDPPVNPWLQTLTPASLSPRSQPRSACATSRRASRRRARRTLSSSATCGTSTAG